ncbi:MAG: TspO/MBR family protein [Hyphomicrobiaceae bacterium]|nr:TspO/MBR family protein [Hyphomicrobiaceae bacterium]
MRSLLRLVACLALCYAIAAVGGYITVQNIPTWYAGLSKPAWTPPNSLFPIVWNILYGMIALSLWLLWDRVAPGPQRTHALRLFGLQLVLNFIWTPVFFGAHWLWTAAAIIVALVLVLALTIRAAWGLDRRAALLLLPYLAWVSYATTLNVGVAALNPG